jgi:hypothetical protein
MPPVEPQRPYGKERWPGQAFTFWLVSWTFLKIKNFPMAKISMFLLWYTKKLYTFLCFLLNYMLSMAVTQNT